MNSRRHAFTLIEMLVTISIMGILVALGVAGFHRAQKMSVGVRCQNNLRQVGSAILLYVSENNQKLPYNATVSAPDYYQYSTGISGALGGNLAPYLGLPSPKDVPKSGVQKVPQLRCPTRATTDTSPSYIVNCQLVGVARNQPFGAQAYGDSSQADPTTFPILATLGNPSTIWALLEADQEITYTKAKGSAWFPSLPLKPVHNGYRNCLYFDGHVEIISYVP